MSGLASAGVRVPSGHAQTRAGPSRPFPQRIAYVEGAIRPSRRTQDEQDEHVRRAYDRWKSLYLAQAGPNGDGDSLMRVAYGRPGTPNHGVTVSEGQGFGMMITAHMAGHDPDAQELFDGLWRFVRANSSSIDNRLMNWRVPPLFGVDSAFDGDADIAYGLLLAHEQWGSGGKLDYASAAKTVIDAAMETTIGPESRLPMLGDWVTAGGDPYSQWTVRTSDFMPGHFRSFGRASGNEAWSDVIAACHDVVDQLQETFSPNTGLLPDFVLTDTREDQALRPADPGFLEGPTDGSYFYNAGRVPWRLGVDALLNGDARSLAQVRRMSTWIEGETNGDPMEIRAGYRLDGTPLPSSDYFSTFFAAPFAVAAMTNPDQQAWLDDLYDAVRASDEEYYEDSVALLCLLALTGTFWDPTVPV